MIALHPVKHESKQPSSMTRQSLYDVTTDEMNRLTPTVGHLLAITSHQAQWICITANAPRLQARELAQYRIECHKVIQLKPSKHSNEYDVVRKAIRSGNMSAIIASTAFSAQEQCDLMDDAEVHHCLIFFLDETRHDVYSPHH